MKKYRVLKTMAVVYKILAWITLVSGVILSIFALVASSLISQQLGAGGAAGGGFVAFVFQMIYTLIGFGSLYALAEGIRLLLDIEEHTRTTEGKVSGVQEAA